MLTLYIPTPVGNTPSKADIGDESVLKTIRSVPFQKIVEIDMSSLRTRHIGNIGMTGQSIRDLHFFNGTLFGISTSNVGASSNLIKIDQTTGRATIIGVVGFPAVTGLTSLTISQLKMH